MDRKCAGAGNPEPVFRYDSPLCDFLYSKFGLQFIFHYSSGHAPYGYTIVDHAETNVYKGSQVMKMDMLIGEPSVGLVGSSLPVQLITDPTGDKPMNISGLTSVSEYRNGYSSFDHSTVNLPDLADDIDDEAILGETVSERAWPGIIDVKLKSNNHADHYWKPKGGCWEKYAHVITC